MTFEERNMILQKINEKYAAIHDKYTFKARILSDAEWDDYIAKMNEISAEYKGTSMDEFSGAICMAYLNDTELMQKKIKEVSKS